MRPSSFALLLAAVAAAGSIAPAQIVSVDAVKVAPGFELTRVHAVQREREGSWIAVAADARGRLLVSDQYGPLYQVTLPRGNDGVPTVAPLPLPIGGVHGLTWLGRDLYAVVGQKAVCAPGLYRLRDTNGDGELDDVALLRELNGEGEHGPHAVVASPDGRSLHVLAGNATALPELTRSRMPRFWADDTLLAPLPALMGSETRGTLPGGWICRTDLDGREWELVCAGFRNAYALAFDAHGELFTFDSDTEFEINLPWYRPTRVLHAVSGADFGWRRGALKIPDRAADAWPSVIEMGLGSPTAVLAPRAARFSAAHRDALWVADWSYGKIFALHLQPHGSTFTATREEIVSGMPLPVTAMCVNPADGALYFTTGGRRLQSALYRLRWPAGMTRSDSPDAPRPDHLESAAGAARRELENFHGRIDTAALEAAWPQLDSDDVVLRHAARTAIESQPVETWRARALRERSPRAALTALLALARVDAARSRPEILGALRILSEASLAPALRHDWLRGLSLTFSRGGEISPEIRASWRPLIAPLFPSTDHETNVALVEMLVFLESPVAAAHGLAALRGAVTRQAQLDLAKSLRVLRTGWTPAWRREFFEWHARATAWRGGASFGRFLQRLRDDALAAAPEEERPALRTLLAEAAAKTAAPDYAETKARPFVRAWTVDDLARLVASDTQTRDPARGRRLFGAAGCFACHAVGGEGGALGPDLTGASKRFSTRDLLEAIVEPSREISDQYNTVTVRLRDGRALSGRIVNLNENGLGLAANLADPANVVRFPEPDVVSVEPAKISLMPPGLLDSLSGEEILDLLAFLRTTPAVASP